MTDVIVGAKDLLVAAAVGAAGGTADWGIYLGVMPDEPDRCISIVRSGGQSANPAWRVDYPSIQVTVRGREQDYFAAAGKAQNIKDVLLGLPSQDLNGDRWVGVWLIGDINSVGVDQKKRPMLTVNFSLIIEPADNVLDHRELP